MKIKDAIKECKQNIVDLENILAITPKSDTPEYLKKLNDIKDRAMEALIASNKTLESLIAQIERDN